MTKLKWLRLCPWCCSLQLFLMNGVRFAQAFQSYICCASFAIEYLVGLHA